MSDPTSPTSASASPTAAEPDYKSTVLLPRTDYPMKAGLDKLEPALQKRWADGRLYERISDARRGAPKYVLHDGPPYATGDLHVGTGLNKVLKDFVVRSRTMAGYDSPYRPGWDCHGLPIESKVMKDLGPKARTTPTPVLRKMCHDYAMKYFARNREDFRRLGILGEWERPYLTVDPAYEAGILDVFADLVEKGYVYRALRPIHWCPTDETALAEAELEYSKETSDSVTVRFPLVDDVRDVFPALPAGAAADLLIWTTTPWTLPANLAIAVAADADYALVKYAEPAGPAAGTLRFVVLAAGLVESNFAKAGITGWEVLGTAKGRGLEGRKYRHVFLDRTGPVVTADYVVIGGGGRAIDETQIVAGGNHDAAVATGGKGDAVVAGGEDDAGGGDAGAGTGLVHTAPGHGREDFLTGRKYGLPVLSPVDAAGRLTPECGVPDLVGTGVFEADPKIVGKLRDLGVLFRHEPYAHQYPHCWRCKRPVLFRATEQWFINVDHDGLRQRMLGHVRNDVEWTPGWGRNRITGMIAGRPDWCISRQRHWGVAIPAFYNKRTGEGLLRADVVRHVRDLFRAHGSGIWFERSAAELLPPGFTHAGDGPDQFEKENAIFDVWFESGASHRSVLRDDPRGLFPAQAYLEGTDQHRGWFQVSLITAAAADGRPPFREVVTHGFVVDGKGDKMSKSSGNYISLADALKFAGADLFRYWVASLDYSREIHTSYDLMKRVHDPYRQFRNTLRILLGNLADFDPARHRVPADRLTPIDRWVLARLAGVVRECRSAYEKHQFFRVAAALGQFCSGPLSGFYVDVLKDRMYCDAPDSPARRSSQTAMYELLSALIRLSAPILVHTAEEAWEHFRRIGSDGKGGGAGGTPDSVHLALLPEVAPETPADAALIADWDRLLALRADVNRELDKLRKAGGEAGVGKSLEAAVVVHLPAGEARDLLVRTGAAELGMLLMVSEVRLADSPPAGGVAGQDLPGATVAVGRSTLPKCRRCWNHRPEVGSVPGHALLCRRCADVVGG